MKSITDDMRTVLLAAGIGSATPTANWSIHISHEPDKPDRCITLYDRGGDQSGYYYNPADKPVRYDMFQVRVRAIAYSDAYAQISAIVGVLDQKHHFQLAGLNAGDPVTKYGGVFLIGRPTSLQKDGKGRSIWVADFRSIRQTKP